MNLKNCAAALKLWLGKKLVTALDVATLRGILQKGVEFLKEKSAATETDLDDWAAEALENIVNDDAKMGKILAFLKSRIAGICEDAPYALTPYEALAADLEKKEGVCESASVSAGSAGFLVAKLLEMLLPVILEYFQSKNREE